MTRLFDFRDADGACAEADGEDIYLGSYGQVAPRVEGGFWRRQSYPRASVIIRTRRSPLTSDVMLWRDEAGVEWRALITEAVELGGDELFVVLEDVRRTDGSIAVSAAAERLASAVVSIRRRARAATAPVGDLSPAPIAYRRHA